jgi:hypothetical protein
MLEVADIVRAAGPEVCASLAVLPSQKRALEAILACRTAVLGGEAYRCEQCGAVHYSYHSCGNRHCPKCHGQQTQQWLEKQRARLLPCPYYLITFTLPSQLRALARSHQRRVYSLLLSAAADALKALCADPHWLGAQPALLGVLHTWTRALLYHPHAHFLVSAGGLSTDGKQWVHPKNPRFLLPVRALSKLFRAKMRNGLRKAGLLAQTPCQIWDQAWVVHAQHAGSGDKALEYLARYVFRIAIANSRLESLENGILTFRYRDNHTQELKRVHLPVREFIQRFLQHVLPQGLPKIRHYGLDGSTCARRREQARCLLSENSCPDPTAEKTSLGQPTQSLPPALEQSVCPYCRQGRLKWIGRIRPPKKFPP